MDSTPPRRLEFHLEGDLRDDGLVLAQDFVAFLSSVLGVLRRLEAERGRKGATGYRIVDLDIGSATVALEPETADSREGTEVFSDFLEGVAAVRDRTIERQRFQPETRRAFLKMVEPLRQHHLRSISVRADGGDIELRTGSHAPVRILAGPEVHSVGELTGFIDAINVHREPVFFLYPVIGPSRVRCNFDRGLLDRVRSSLKRHVSVFGLIEYPEGSPFASRITVERIEVHPEERDLTPIDSLRGILPDLTGGLDSVAYVRQVRDAQE
jgi:hypothetical protein